jgi:hypothetical protein
MWRGGFSEAASLLWPDGPLTATSLRTAARDGLLDVAEVAGKLLTTKAALKRMSACRPRGREVADDTPGFRCGSGVIKALGGLRYSTIRMIQDAEYDVTKLGNIRHFVCHRRYCLRIRRYNPRLQRYISGIRRYKILVSSPVLLTFPGTAR